MSVNPNKVVANIVNDKSAQLEEYTGSKAVIRTGDTTVILTESDEEHKGFDTVIINKGGRANIYDWNSPKLDKGLFAKLSTHVEKLSGGYYVVPRTPKPSHRVHEISMHPQMTASRSRHVYERLNADLQECVDRGDRLYDIYLSRPRYSLNITDMTPGLKTVTTDPIDALKRTASANLRKGLLTEEQYARIIYKANDALDRFEAKFADLKREQDPWNVG